MAYHFALAGDGPRAAEYALAAARRAVATYAYQEALLHLQRAIESLGEDGPAATRLALNEAAGDVYALEHEGTRAIEAFQRALQAWRDSPGDPIDAIRLHRKLVQTGAESKYAVGRDGFRALHAAMNASEENLGDTLADALHREPHPEIARLLAVLSIAAWRVRHPPAWTMALEHAQAAVRMAEELEAPIELSAALDALSAAYFGLGKPVESRDAALRRLAVTRQSSFVDERECLDALRGAGAAHISVGEYELAIPLLLEAEHIAGRIQSADQIFNALSLLTLAWLRLDRWAEIRARQEVWDDLERQYAQERTGPLCWPIALRAVVETLSGESAAGADLRERSVEIMERTFGRDDWLRNAHY